MKDKKNTVCLVASSGGHLTQLLYLENAWKGLDCFYVTTSNSARATLIPKGKCYIVTEASRNHPLTLLRVIYQSFNIFVREKPQIILSTGSGTGCLLCLLGKILFRCKVIWVDSIANTQILSLSGRIARYFADICLTQWPSVANKYKNVRFAGAVL